jgi:excisionase family DNA binding protein
MTDDTTSATARLSGFLTVAAFCQWSGLSRTKVYSLIKSGELRAVKCGRSTRITEAEAARWRDALPPLLTAPPGPTGQNGPISLASPRRTAGTTLRAQR